jgi:solute carrier family 8 (sodium/calcium exchanger)
MEMISQRPLSKLKYSLDSQKKTDLDYVWQGNEYENYSYNPQPRGYIQEYSNKPSMCTTGLFFPGVSLVSEGVLGVACLLLLLYLFLGVAIVADLFMEAIEVITSSKVIVHVMDPQNPSKTIPVERDFWNPTIANLTLLALGSSMPEILLSVFSTVGDLDGVPSELGPMGIVGSAAFNLFVISAVSVMAVTDGSKKILDMGVFMWTSFASSFAYLWFLLTLAVFSPDQIEVWEAFTTLGFFIVLCLVALVLDKWTSAKNRALEHEKNVKVDAARFVLKQL